MRRDYGRKWRDGVVSVLSGAILLLTLYSITGPVVAALNAAVLQNQTISFLGHGTTSYGVGTVALSATASSGLVVSFSSDTTSVCDISGSTATILGAGTCTVTASQVGNESYAAASPVTRSFTVTKTYQTISFGYISSKSLDTKPFTLMATASSGLSVSFVSATAGICTVSDKTVTLISQGVCKITANQEGNSNYNTAPPVSQAFNVRPIDQTISFAVLLDKTFGDDPFSISATSSSGLAATFSSLTPAVCSVSDSSVSLIAAGVCGIAANQPGNNYYSAASRVWRFFTVQKRPQTISFDPLPMQWLNKPNFTVSATATSGLPVSFDSATPWICSVSGIKVSLLAKGICMIMAHQDGNANYQSSRYVTQSAAVLQGGQPGNAATFISESIPDRLRAGQPFTVAVTMANTGSTTWTETSKIRLGSQVPQDNRYWTISGRATIPEGISIRPGESYTFQIPITAPAAPRSYLMHWQMMQEGVEWFGDITPIRSVEVIANSGPTATLKVTPTNARMNGATTVKLVFSGSSAETGHTITKLELFQSSGSPNGYSPVPINVVNGSGSSLTIDYATDVIAGTYWYKLRATDDAGTMTESIAMIVNVTNSSMLGEVSGVRTDSGKPQLVGWVCQPGVNESLAYQVFLDAPTLHAGGQLITSGKASVSTEPDYQIVQSKCATSGVGHHFVVDLSPYSTIYGGRTFYVQASAPSGGDAIVLPCADDSCVIPGTLRIALGMPNNGMQFSGPTSMFIFGSITGATAPFDEVAFSVDGSWVAGKADSMPGYYYAISSKLPARSAPYLIQAKVRQGDKTAYSAINMVTVVPNGQVDLTQTSPGDGSSFAAGASIPLGATVTGTGVQSVQFYANGTPVGSGINNNGVWSYGWTDSAAGAYGITSKAFDGSGHQLAESSVVNITVTAGLAGSGTPVPVMVSAPNLNDPNAGTLPGNLAVDATGAANYTMSIVVPPGTAGMQPALSFNYRSLNSNGMLGLGWSLSGMSSIQRCAKTVAQDGVADRITFANSDRLCFEGNRLVRADGANPGTDLGAKDAAYWEAGAVYRTEIETFTRFSRQANGGFKAEFKDGHVEYFAIDANSAAQAEGRSDGQPMQWMLARVEDRSGNYLTWTYNNDASSGEVTPRQIRYGGNTDAKQSPDLAVNFSYQARGDVQTVFVGGSHSDAVTRLTDVKTYIGTDASGNDGSLVRDYVLAYHESLDSGRSLVDSVKVKAANPNTGLLDELPATTFAWGGSGGVVSVVSGTASALPYFATTSGTVPAPIQLQGNLDGSGRTSLVAVERKICRFCDTGPYVTGLLRVRSPDGSQSDVTVDFSPLRNANDPNLNFDPINAAPTTIQFADIDGDGRDDIVAIDQSDITGNFVRWGVCLNRGPVGGPLAFTCVPGGVNGPSFMVPAPMVIDLHSDKRAHLVSAFNKDLNGSDCAYDSNTFSFQCKPLQLISGSAFPPELSKAYNFYSSTGYGGLPLLKRNFFTPSGINLGRPSMSDLYTVWTAEVPAGDVNNPYDTRQYFDQSTSATVWKPIDLIQGVTVCFNRQNGISCQMIDQRRSSGKTMQALSAPAQSVGDLNGDGLTDFIYTVGARKTRMDCNLSTAVDQCNLAYGIVSPSTVMVCLSTENGVQCKADPIQLQPNADHSDPTATAHVDDFLGDGVTRVLFDIVPNSPDTNGATSKLCRYTANGLSCNDIVYTGTSSCTALMCDIATAYLDDSGVPTRYTTGLKNSDGLNTYIPVTMTAPAGQDKLVSVINGIGQQSKTNQGEVTYARGDDSTVYARFAKVNGTDQRPVYPKVLAPPGVLVKELRRDNGSGGKISTDYAYAGAMTDAWGRDPFGFGMFQVTDVANQLTTVSTLAHDFPHAGEVLHSTTTSRNGYAIGDVVNDPNDQTFAFANGGATRFPFFGMVTVTKKELDGTPVSVTTQAYQYADGWGNLTQLDESVAGGGSTFTSNTKTNYNNTDTTWLIGLPTLTTVTRTNAAGASLTRTSNYDYDGSGLLRHEWLEKGSSLESSVTHDRSGNSFGLVNTSKQEWKDPYVAATVSRNIKDVGYDAKGRFVTTTKDTKGNQTKLTYYDGTGVMASLKDPNGLTTTWTADGFGRVQSVLRPDGNTTYTYNKQCVSSCPFGGVKVVSITTLYHGDKQIATPKVAYLDAAGHELRALSYGLNGEQIYKDSRYDAQGRLWQVDLPHLGTTAILGLTNFYDDLGRIYEIETSDDDGSTLTTKYKFSGLQTVITDANNHDETQTRDALGRLTQVVDRAGGVTSMTYDPFGNLLTTTDPNTNVVSITYDLLGRKTDLNDPDLGLTHYDIDPVGRVWKQTSANQAVYNAAHPGETPQATRFEYDTENRVTLRKETDLTSHWEYDTASKGIGRISKAYTGSVDKPDYLRTHSYDAITGLPVTVSQYIGINTRYDATVGYDGWNRLSSQTYLRTGGSQKVFNLNYNGYGELWQVQRGTLVLWQANTADALGRVTNAQLGNGLTQTAAYKTFTTRLDGKEVRNVSGLLISDSYHYDKLGNVSFRSQHWNAASFDESFGYDNLNRLTSSTIGANTKNFRYDAAGNMTLNSATSSGNYTYPAPQGPGVKRPHAVQGIPGIGNFIYDDNGNLTSGVGRSLTWFSFDMPASIVRGTTSSQFVYGPEHQRTRQDRSDGVSITYAGAQEVEQSGSDATVKTYWPNGLGVEMDRPDGTTELYWFHTDELGSPIAISRANGQLKEPLAYEPWGRRRNPDGSTAPDTLDGQTDNKGYTGHEMLDQLDLVHMNARVYDPLVARFVSADPHVTDPTDGQSYNRYSYVSNNPLGNIDPTGFDRDVIIHGPGPSGGTFSAFTTLFGGSGGFFRFDQILGSIGNGRGTTRWTATPVRSANSGGSKDYVGQLFPSVPTTIGVPAVTGAPAGDNSEPMQVVEVRGKRPGGSSFEIQGPSFFSLTTFEGAKWGTTLDQAVRRGAPFRNVTVPVVVISGSAPTAAAAAAGVGATGVLAYDASVEAFGTLRTWRGIFGFIRALNKYAGEDVAVEPPPPPTMSESALRNSISQSKALRDGMRSGRSIEAIPPTPTNVP